MNPIPVDLTGAMIIQNIVNAGGPLTGVIFLLFITCLGDVATGMFAAWKSGTLSLAYADNFVMSHIQQKWAPILGTLLGGIAVGGVDNALGAILIAAATGQIVAYEGQVFGHSIPASLSAASSKTKGGPGGVMLVGTIESTDHTVATFNPDGTLATVSTATPPNHTPTAPSAD